MKTLLISLFFCAALHAQFPALKANNLNGDEVSLPAGLEGERNLLIISFTREQQSESDTWVKPGAAPMRPYVIPVIGKVNRLIRGFIEKGMRSGIASKEARARMIPLFVEKASLVKALAVTAEDHIAVLLVDRAGKILWRESGAFTAARGASLSAYH